MPNVDDDTVVGFAMTSSRLVTNGKQVTVTLDLGYSALLVGGDTWDNNSLTVCDTRYWVIKDIKPWDLINFFGLIHQA